MRWIKNALSVLLGLLIVVLGVAGLGWVVYQTVTKAPAVVAAVVTGVLAVLGVGVQRYMEQQRAAEEQRRVHLAPIYERLVATFYRGAAGGGLAEEELTEFFTDLAQQLLMWAPPPVIQAFNNWRTSAAAADADTDHVESLLVFEELLRAMRADLGNDDKSLPQGDLLRVFINDIDDFLPVESAANVA